MLSNGMKHNVTDLDQEAYETLLPIAGIEDPNALYEGMNGAKMSMGMGRGL